MDNNRESEIIGATEVLPTRRLPRPPHKERKWLTALRRKIANTLRPELFAEAETIEVGEHQFTGKEGRYDRVIEIARGGMGAVFRIFDRDLERYSAMKIALPHILRNPANISAFLTEGKITAQLEHPNIMPVHDMGVLEDGGLFFSMKLVGGKSLAQILEKLRYRDSEMLAHFSRFQLLTIFRKVCDAIAFAHSRGVIHRDIKPDNIMVGDYGEVLLLDWGIARRLPLELSRSEEAAVKSGQGVIQGSPNYMAPEQARGQLQRLSQRTDIFLLGATLYHMITLNPPYAGNDMLEDACHGRIIPPAERNPSMQIPEALSAIIMRAVAVNADERYASVEELAAELDAFMAGKTAGCARVFQPGQYLMRGGEFGGEGYAIVRGKVNVVRETAAESVQLTCLGPGDVVGEMAVITGEPRSASVVAAEETEVEVITSEQIEAELRKLAPWMARIINRLALRLRETSRRVQAVTIDSLPMLIAQQIFFLAPGIGLTKDNCISFDLDYLVAALANQLQQEQAAVAMALDILAEQQLVQINHATGGIVIPDAAALAAVALQQQPEAAF